MHSRLNRLVRAHDYPRYSDSVILMTAPTREFQEVGHCGGQVTVNVRTNEKGERGVSFGIQGSSPTPAAWFAVYVLPQAIPVGTIRLGGIGDPWNPPPHPSCYPVFIGSDSQGLFGHQCPQCRGYWRSDGAPSRWLMTCAYCGLRAEAHHFVTPGQTRFIQVYCDLLEGALSDEKDGEHVLDLDAAAKYALEGKELPKFYYAEESQQNKFTCQACRRTNDILGRYGYCSSCRTHNGLQEAEAEIATLRNRVQSTSAYEAGLQDAVTCFDSFARQIAKQLVAHVPMSLRRKNEWKRQLFHNIESAADALSSQFDIDVFRNVNTEERQFAIRMFHRRHVYEHNGGEVDEKYIRDSGDTTVRPKQTIRETRESVERILRLVSTLSRNIHEGFHVIFPVEDMPIQLERDRLARMQKRGS